MRNLPDVTSDPFVDELFPKTHTIPNPKTNPSHLLKKPENLIKAPLAASIVQKFQLESRLQMDSFSIASFLKSSDYSIEPSRNLLALILKYSWQLSTA